MRYTGFFPSCPPPLLRGVRGDSYCLLPLAFPSWEGLGVGSSCLLPVPYSLLPTPYSLFPIPYSLLPTPYSL
ncbi:MAG: hypothetical protein F6K56_42235 [Moorea sp. SIO3G5]|nr:hypothetical protein [Moorena sp. SIO3G5]